MPIIIKSKKEGFRRCGVAHPKQEKTYKDGFFNEDQLSRLEKEPMLTVTRMKDPGGQDGGNGHRIQGAPEDEADFLAWLEGLTVPDLKEICTDIEIDVPAKAKKADLIELITFNTAFPAGDPEE